MDTLAITLNRKSKTSFLDKSKICSYKNLSETMNNKNRPEQTPYFVKILTKNFKPKRVYTAQIAKRDIRY